MICIHDVAADGRVLRLVGTEGTSDIDIAEGGFQVGCCIWMLKVESVDALATEGLEAHDILITLY